MHENISKHLKKKLKQNTVVPDRQYKVGRSLTKSDKENLTLLLQIDAHACLCKKD